MTQRGDPQAPAASAKTSEATLIAHARDAAATAYCPYSRFAVGAALRARDGRIYTGANVENAAYPVGMCAERVALYHAVTHGAAPGSFDTIVIHTDTPRPTAPCGACRQALSELAPGVEVIMATREGPQTRARIEDLLPGAFGPADLGGRGRGPDQA